MKDYIQMIKGFSKKQKTMAITCSLVFAVTLVGIPVYAWFSNQRKAAVMTKIDAPTTLYIFAGGQQEDAANIDLGDIYIKQADLEAGNNMYAEYVFCVAGKDVSYYDLQLAHTTNIPFTYDIYHAVDVTDSGNAGQINDSVEYKSAKIANKKYYYAYGDGTYVGSAGRDTVQLEGRYINKDDGEDGTGFALPNSDQKGAEINGKSYDIVSDPNDPTNKADNVQINAYPLYWQTSDSIEVYRNAKNNETLMDDIKTNGFNDYYILRISWSDDINLTDKETDIIYITAKVGTAKSN